MNKILIIGLGLIGGSYAKKLTSKGYDVYGLDIDENTIDYAIKNKIIKDGKTTVSKEYLSSFDKIIFGLYPSKLVEFVNNYHDYFKKGALISDVTGVKEVIVYKVQELLKDQEFIGAHPMAGKEVYGIENSDGEMFNNANYIITPTDKNTMEGIDFAMSIGKALDFKTMGILSPERHDEMIAYLSQLTHCIAMALMTCKDTTHLVAYTGDSFNDLTRIANINENMWSELFLDNKDKLVSEIDLFVKELEKLKKYIKNEDVEKIKKMMVLSSKRRKAFIKK